MLRTPQMMFFAAVQPVLFVLGLTAVFGGLVEHTIGGAYIKFLLPGVVVMNLMFAAGSTGLALAEDMKAGIIDRFRSLPMTRSAVLAARALTDLIRNTGAVVVMIAAGFLLGFRPGGSAFEALLALALSLFFSFAVSMGFAALALAVKDPQTVQFATFAPVLPLIFLSSAWLPISTMTPAVRGFAHYQPVNITVVAVRSLSQGTSDWSTVGQATAWASVMAIGFGVIATRLYRNTAT
jgi:ABC-2 type transport system permease protein/oleandomycin transport system permease protein